jgi:Thiamine pyrophosphate-requiring enzymes [acetolactate synthase, pyruvate dehydrogenase (cytochrome), glyoxylate carboligase, phosphonopyruvate decarboxylase]
MKISGAEAVALILKKLGVSNIWGIPGSKTLSVYNAIKDIGIHSVLVTNELSASFMADGYYRVSGKPGVCIAIPGPGLTNMLTGIAEAYLDSSAMLVITVNPKKTSHSFYIHEIPQLEIVKPVVKNVVKISSILQINELFGAYHSSYKDEPGPVVVEIGSQVMDQEIEELELAPEVLPALMNVTNEAVAKIVKYIREARQVGIYAGRGCMGAGNELLEMSKILSAPIATTISGRGVVPEDYELSTGYGFGRTGSPAAYRVFKNCDLILAVGTKFSEMATGGWGLKFNNMIHIDAAKNNLDKNYSSLFSVQADAQKALEELNKSLSGVTRPVNVKAIEEIKKFKIGHAAKIGKKRGSGYLHPAKFLQELRRCLPRDAILSTDVGYHQLWSISDFEVFEPATYLTPADYQAMGFGIPTAIGAAMARPDKKVACVCGDGGFLISGFELLTAVREKINLSVFVFNDGALGLIKGLQEKIFNRNISVDLNNPDFEQLANSFGVQYLCISEETNLKEKLETVLEHKGVNLVECKIVYDEFPLYIKGGIRNSWDQAPLSRKMSILYRYVKCRL